MQGRQPFSRRWCVIAGTIFVGAVATGLSAPGQEPVFRAGTELISVDVSVLDGDRRPIRDLTPADFIILEDGQPRPIAAFSHVELPAPVRALVNDNDATSSWMRDAARDVVENDLPAEGRLVTIVFDRSIPAGVPVQSAREIATAIVDEVAPGDLVAVARSSGFANEGGRIGFTSDRRFLLEAIHSPFMGMTSAELNPSPIPGQDPSTTDCYCGLCVYDTLNQVAAAMRDSPRRRKILLFVGGAISIQEPDPASPSFSVVKEPRNRLMRELEMSNVTVHSIDTVGLVTTSLTAAFVVEEWMTPIGMAKIPAQRNAANAVRLDNLRVLPDHTGGRLVANTNAPAELLPALLEESRSYYLLGFEPSRPEDGEFHRIDVRVNRRDATVHGRRWYTTAPPDSAGAIETAWRRAVPEDLARALRAPLPLDAVRLRLNATPLLSAPGATTPVAVVVGAGLPPQAATRRLAMTAGAFDDRGRAIVVHNQTVELPGLESDAGWVDEGLMARLDLPPGRFEIRVAVRDEATGAVGSVYGFVDVPNIGHEPLTLGGPVLRGPSPPFMQAHALSDLVRFVPTIGRRFAATDEILALVQIQTVGAASSVTVRTTIVDDADRVRSIRTDTIEAVHEAVAPLEIPLGFVDLAPGPYLLQVEATAGGLSVAKSTRFEVVTQP